MQNWFLTYKKSLLIIGIIFCSFFVSTNTFAANRYWVGAAGASINTTASWSATTGGVSGASIPGSADIAIFDGAGVGNTNATVDLAGWTVASISITAGYTQTIAQNASISIGQDFTDAGTISWALTSGTMTYIAGASHSTLTCTGTLPTTIILSKGGNRNFTVSSGCEITLQANQNSSFASNGNYFTNNGTINIPSGTWTITGITLVNNGTINHNGTSFTVVNTWNGLSNSATGVFNFPNGASFVLAGYLTNAGTINYPGTVLDIGGSFSNTGTFVFSGSTLNVGGSWNMTGNTFDLTGKTVTFGLRESGTLTCTSTFPAPIIISKNTSSVGFTIAAGCTVNLTDNPTTTFGGNGNAFTNNGTINVPSGTWTINGAGITNNGTINHNGTGFAPQYGLINNTGAVFNFLNGTNFTTRLWGPLTNAGTINYPGTATTSVLYVGGDFSNTGTFAYNGLSLSVGGSWNTAGNTFDLTGKTVTFSTNSSGTLTCSGVFPATVIIYKNTSSIGFTISAGCTVNLTDNPTTTFGANGNYFINNGTINIPSGTWNIVGMRLTNNGTVNHNGTGFSVAFELDNTATGIFNFAGGTSMVIGGSLTNSGTINYGGINMSIGGSWNATIGTFNATGKVITFTNTPAATFTCVGVFPGTIVISKTGNSGGFTLVSGCSISLGANPSTVPSGNGNFLTNNGTITVDSGTWTITEGWNSSRIINNGIINHNGTSLVMNITSYGAFTNATSGVINFPNAVSISDTASFSNYGIINIGGATTTITASPVNYSGGNINVTSTSSLTVSGSLTNNSGGAISFSNSPNLVVTSSLINNGFFTFPGTSITVGVDFTPGIFNLVGKNVIFNTSSNGIFTGTFGGSLILNKGAANTLTLANDITVVNATTIAGVLANVSKIMTITGNLSIADGAKFGGALLNVKMSSTSDQNISVTTGSILTPLEINKTGGRAILQTNYTGIGAPAVITVATGTLYLNGKTLLATTTVSSGGEFQVQGRENLATLPTLASGSTFTYVGDGDGTTDTYYINTSIPYSNLKINSVDTSDIFTFSAIPTNGLVSYWSFDGDSNDKWGTNNANPINAPILTTGAGGLANTA